MQQVLHVNFAECFFPVFTEYGKVFHIFQVAKFPTYLVFEKLQIAKSSPSNDVPDITPNYTVLFIHLLIISFQR